MMRGNPFEDPEATPGGNDTKVARADGDVSVPAPDLSGVTSGGGKLSGDNIAEIVTGVVGGLGSILGSIFGAIGNKNNGSSGNTTSQQTAYIPVKQNNTWIWVAGAALVVGLVVFLVLKKKK